jgi:hypothetical protein
MAEGGVSDLHLDPFRRITRMSDTCLMPCALNPVRIQEICAKGSCAALEDLAKTLISEAARSGPNRSRMLADALVLLRTAAVERCHADIILRLDEILIRQGSGTSINVETYSVHSAIN